MIRELMAETYIRFRQYAGEGSVPALYVASVVVLLCLCPVFFKKRRPMLLSVIVTPAVAVTQLVKEVCTKTEGKKIYRYARYVFVAFLVLLLVTTTGDSVFSGSITTKKYDDMHMPSDLAKAIDVVIADKEDAKVLTMPGWGLYVKAYTSKCETVYTDPKGGDISGFDEDLRVMYTELSKDHPAMKKIAMRAHAVGADHVILSNAMWPEFPITYYGYELVEAFDTCSVYREVRTP